MTKKEREQRKTRYRAFPECGSCYEKRKVWSVCSDHIEKVGDPLGHGRDWTSEEFFWLGRALFDQARKEGWNDEERLFEEGGNVTRRDYDKFARMFGELKQVYPHSTPSDDKMYPDDVVNDVIDRVCRIFREDNPNFKEEMFRKYCKL